MEENTKKKVAIGIIIVIIVAVAVSYFVFRQKEYCGINPKTTLTNIAQYGKTLQEVQNFCGTTYSEKNCADKKYYVYTEASNELYSLSESGNVEGKTLVASIDNVCEWIVE